MGSSAMQRIKIEFLTSKAVEPDFFPCVEGKEKDRDNNACETYNLQQLAHLFKI